LALTSPTSGGRSIGIFRLRTQTTEFVLFCFKDYLEYDYCILEYDTVLFGPSLTKLGKNFLPPSSGYKIEKLKIEKASLKIQ
jgi:hypothetical protein